MEVVIGFPVERPGWLYRSREVLTGLSGFQSHLARRRGRTSVERDVSFGQAGKRVAGSLLLVGLEILGIYSLLLASLVSICPAVYMRCACCMLPRSNAPLTS